MVVCAFWAFLPSRITIDPGCTNKATHEEVLEAGDIIAPKLMKIVRRWLGECNFALPREEKDSVIRFLG